jgi:hypothetical protein
MNTKRGRSARVALWLLMSVAVSQWLGAIQAAEAETIAIAAPLAAYYDLIYAVSVGQADAAIAQFTDDAIVISGANCTINAPCIGKSAIRERYIIDLIARHVNPPFTDQRYDGMHLTTQGEVTYVKSCSGEWLRLIGGHIFEFRDGQIASLTSVPEKGETHATRLMACKITK